MRRGRFTGVIAVLISIILLTGCGSSSYVSMNDSATSSGYSGMEYYDSADGGYDYGSSISDSKTSSDTTVEIAPEEAASNSGTDTTATDTTGTEQSSRKLIYRETLSVETLEFDTFIMFVESQTQVYGGYIEASSSSGNSYGYEGKSNRYATYTLRIPTKYLETMLGDIGNQANVTSTSGTTEDITLQYIDNQTHMEALQVEQDRLMELLEKAEALEDILQIESRLSDLRYKIEYYGSILRNYDNLVEYSTIYLNISEVERITDVEVETAWERMTSGLKDTFYNIKEGSVDFGVDFVINLPYILIWAVIILVVILIIRRAVKRSNKKRDKKREQIMNGQQTVYQQPYQQQMYQQTPVQQNSFVQQNASTDSQQNAPAEDNTQK